MNTRNLVLCLATIAVVACLAAYLSHSWASALFPIVGGVVALKFGKRMQPAVDELKLERALEQGRSSLAPQGADGRPEKRQRERKAPNLRRK